MFIFSLRARASMCTLLVSGILCLFLCPAPGFCQDILPERFSVLLWPYSTTILGTDNTIELLTEEWYNTHLPRVVDGPLELIRTRDWSINAYRDWIIRNRPALIEGERTLVEQALPSSSAYIPILFAAAPPAEYPPAVLLEKDDLRRDGILGVISPFLETGGLSQIRHWVQTRSREPDIVALGSPEEVVRHLLVGSIVAAALPQGTLEAYLESMDRIDLADRFTTEVVESAPPRLALYLREDLYQRALLRTLVQENWLRDTLPTHLKLYSQDAATVVP